MSLFYRQEFESVEPLWAEVKEELRSYFAAGSIDDVMFPKWTQKCLEKLQKSAFKIEQTLLEICDYQCELPENFRGVREAWACTTLYSDPFQNPASQYYQKDCRIDIPVLDKCDPCFLIEDCTTDFLVTHKITNTHMFSYRRQFLLRPGNATCQLSCDMEHMKKCGSLHQWSNLTFDIQNCKFITNFCDGKVNLQYYAATENEYGEILIPKDTWVYDYIKAYIVYKCFQQLSNTITDETFNQIDKKKQEAKAEYYQAKVLAETSLKKQTANEKIRQIGKSYQQNNKYRLPGDQSGEFGQDWISSSYF